MGFTIRRTTRITQPLEYRLNNSVPNLITQRAFPIRYKSDLNSDLGIFVQDRWSLNRVTATLGMRFDYFKSGFPEQTTWAFAAHAESELELSGVRQHQLEGHHASAGGHLRRGRRR